MASFTKYVKNKYNQLFNASDKGSVAKFSDKSILV